MRTLKKLGLGIFLGFFMLLTGCGSSESSGSDADEKKTLRLVTDAAYAPMEYMEGDKIVGFDIDFVKAVAAEAGYELKVEHVGWEPLFIEIDGGNADLAISSISITEDRKESYDFSVPYYISTNEILVPEGSSIKGAEDLKDKKVAVQKDTTGHLIAESLLGDKNPNIKPFETTPLAIQELMSNGADAVIADKPVVDYYVKNNPEQKLVIIPEDSFEQEYYGLLFPKGSSLIDDFNKAINTLIENGKYAEIYKQWFGEEPDIDALKALQ